MLHLFKRCYITSDSYVDSSVNRIVVSQQKGYPLLSSIEESSQGTLVGYGKSIDEIIGPESQFDSFTSFVNYIDAGISEFDSKIIIYADATAFAELTAMWFKSILKYAKAADVFAYIKAHDLYVKYFHSGRNAAFDGTVKNVPEDTFKKTWAAVPPDQLLDLQLVESLIPHLSVEFYVASYLYDGSRKTELKSAIVALMKKDLYVWIREIKEFVCTQIVNPIMRDTLGLSQNVESLSNIEDFVSQLTSPFNVLFDPKLWKYPDLINPPAGIAPINVEYLTPERIKEIKQVVDLVSEEWPFIRSFYAADTETGESNKINFLDIARRGEMTDKELEEIIEFEMNPHFTTGLFHNLDVGTTNDFFIDFILYAPDTKETAKPYRV